jgi:site-specific recombinase XerD
MAVNLNEAALLQFERHLVQISLSPKTIASYLADLRVFTRWGTQANRDHFSIVQVSPDHIRAYLAYLLEDLGRTPATANRHLQALRKWCAFITKTNLVSCNAAEEISLVPLEAGEEPQGLSATACTALLEAAEDTRVAIAKRDVAILTLLLRTGLRVSEVVNLNVDDVVFDYPGVHLKIQDGRGRGAREIPITPDVCRKMKEYLLVRSKASQSQQLFLTQEGSGLSARTVQRIVYRCTRQANLRGVTAQLLRRTYAMNLLHETQDLDLVRERLGHQTTNITLRYLNLQDEKEVGDNYHGK